MSNEPCTRCKADIIGVHPYAWMVVDTVAPLLDDSPLGERDRSVLCCHCMLLLGEFLVPELKNLAEWISGKDQLLASLRDRAQDNE
jgi:hypothetical protein